MTRADDDAGANGARATMAGLVSSLADNKAALGRRYAEWAVSAPSLESAVAAAAMAQDELGHSRSTYPVLKSLGIEHEEADRGRRLTILDEPLEDWSAVIAVNMLVDGVLSTFVAACVSSSIEPMAQRARKILQEEGSHRIHAEAWAKRFCRAGDPERTAFLELLTATWQEAGRWVGPDDDPGFRAAMDAAMVSMSPSEQRDVVRGWLADLLSAEGIELMLEDPTDWSRWDSNRRRWVAP